MWNMKYIIKKKLHFWEYLIRGVDWIERIIEKAEEKELTSRDMIVLGINTRRRKKKLERNFLYYTLRNVR